MLVILSIIPIFLVYNFIHIMVQMVLHGLQPLVVLPVPSYFWRLSFHHKRTQLTSGT